MKLDPYRTLRIKRTASAEDVEAAYRSLARKMHPDRGGDAKKFHHIQLAYECLSDPVRRSNYDATGDLGGGAQPSKDIEACVQVLTACFQGVIKAFMENGLNVKNQDVRQHMLMALNQFMTTTRAERDNLLKAERILQACIDKFSVKVPVIGTDEMSVLNGMVRLQIAEVQGELARNSVQIDAQKRAKELLERTEFSHDVQPMFSTMIRGGLWTSSTGY